MSQEMFFTAGTDIALRIEDIYDNADPHITQVERNGQCTEIYTPDLSGKQNKAFVLTAFGVNPFAVAYFLRKKPEEVTQLLGEVAATSGAENVEQAITFGFMNGDFSAQHPSYTPELNIGEMDVLKHLAAGNKKKMMADFLGLTERAATIREAMLFRKLGAITAAEAVTLGFTNHIIDPEDAAIFRPIEATMLQHTPYVKTQNHKPLKEDTPSQFFLRGGLVTAENPLDLTAYEQRVLLLKSFGLDSKTISHILGIPHGTALDPLHLYEKFGAHNAQGAVAAAFSNGTYTIEKPITESIFRESDRPSITLLAKGVFANNAIPIIGSGANLRGKSRTLFHKRIGAPNAVGAVTLACMTNFLDLNTP